MSFIPVTLAFSCGENAKQDLLEDIFAEKAVTLLLMAVPRVGDTMAIKASLFPLGFVACAAEQYGITQEDDGDMWFEVKGISHHIDAEGKQVIKVRITFA